jgi:hypothetical protein
MRRSDTDRITDRLPKLESSHPTGALKDREWMTGTR